MDDTVNSTISSSLPLSTEIASSSSTSKNSNIVIIGGSVAGVIIFLILVIIVFFFLRRRREPLSSHLSPTLITPFFEGEARRPMVNPIVPANNGSNTLKPSGQLSKSNATSYSGLDLGQTRGGESQIQNQETVSRMAWLEGEVYRLQGEVEGRDYPESLPGYSVITNPTN